MKETFLSKEIKIAFKQSELYKNDEGIGYLFNFLKMLFYDIYFIPYVHQLIYEFDEPSIILFKNAGMSHDGTLESHVYKWGKYYNVFVYGMTRERFGEITGLKCETE
ncbi:MAG: GNAT family N-acetyltransferase [bacterium]